MHTITRKIEVPPSSYKEGDLFEDDDGWFHILSQRRLYNLIEFFTVCLNNGESSEPKDSILEAIGGLSFVGRNTKITIE